MPGGIIRVDAPVGARGARLARAAGDQRRPDQLRPGRRAGQDGRGHPDQGPRQGRRRHRAPTRSSSPTPGAGSQSIADFVRGLDIRTPQVSIQAKIIFVDRTDIEQLGLKYDLGSQQPVLQQARPAARPGQPGRHLRARTSTSSTSAATRCPPSATPTRTSPARRSTWSSPPRIGGFALTIFLSALEQTRARRHPGRADHHHARQPPGRHPGR